ncbi:MAG: Stp1/IreP family PP2C-type Ser/Thr phosphatase [Microscillaceae bacterium]|jgi:serine/threonine protein phosphatase PrpC|nr:Stp1/IreP family PP2C-type Ser/Thr phosphatase [Microscillaceae bacterium]
MYNDKNFRFGNHTDIGRIRKQNEDYMGYFENQNGIFFVVCDGMGGHVGGAVASQTAVQSIRDYFEREHYDVPSEAIYQAIQYANQQIFQKAQYNLDLRGMGTTCVLVMLRGGKLYYGHVGDSRLYLHNFGKSRRLTRDHSVVQALIDQGVLSEDDAENHPRRNELLRALGTQSFVDVEVSQEPIIPKRDDIFMLCSDGLNSLVSDAGIEEVLNTRLDPQQKAMRLVETANALGGYDNITVQVIEFTSDSKTTVNVAQNTNFSPIGDSKLAMKGSIEPDYIEPLSEIRTKKKSKLQNSFQEAINLDLSDVEADYRPLMFRVFSGLVLVVFLYVLYQNTLGSLNLLGSSGDLRVDSLKALDIEQRFYTYFWNASPGLQKVKNTIDQTKKTIDDTRKTLQEIRDFKQKFLDKFNHRQVRNSLGEEKLNELARRYRTKIEWILKANQVKSESELKQLDTLIVPLEEPPTLPNQPAPTDSTAKKQ